MRSRAAHPRPRRPILVLLVDVHRLIEVAHRPRRLPPRQRQRRGQRRQPLAADAQRRRHALPRAIPSQRLVGLT